jgi:DNA-binding MarR family transcriptional regulator
MEAEIPSTPTRRGRRLTAQIKESLRELNIQLALLNHQVVTHLGLNDADLHCLEILSQRGPLGPSTLARSAGLHPATITGILDRLERGGWVVRERSSTDRRAVTVRPLHDRVTELFGLYAGMNTSMDDVCAGYTETELEVIDDFLRRTTRAGEDAAGALSIS